MLNDAAVNYFTEEEMKAVLKVLRTGNFQASENVNAFEKQVTEKLGCKYAVMTNSGSSAMLIAVASLFYKKDMPLKKGDEVILPALLYPSLCSPLHQFGLKLKFLDVEMHTLTLDVQYLERALTPNTKAVVASNTLGNPAHLETIKAFCKKNGLYFIEDNTDGFGADYKGKKCGTFGDIGICGTGFSHALSTIEGGLFITDNTELYHLAKALRSYGLAKNLPPESPLYERGNNEWAEAHRVLVPGYNVRPLEITGALGSEQLKKIETSLNLRRANQAAFVKEFQGDPRFILQKENGKSSWYSFSILINSMLNVDFTAVMKALANEQIFCRPISGGNIVQQNVIKFYDHECVSDLRISNLVHERGFCLLNHTQDLTKHITRLYKVLTSVTGGTIKKAA